MVCVYECVCYLMYRRLSSAVTGPVEDRQTRVTVIVEVIVVVGDNNR